MKKLIGVIVFGLMSTGIMMAAPDKGCCSSKEKKEASCSSKEKKEDKTTAKETKVVNAEKAACCSKDDKNKSKDCKKEATPNKKA